MLLAPAATPKALFGGPVPSSWALRGPTPAGRSLSGLARSRRGATAVRLRPAEAFLTKIFKKDGGRHTSGEQEEAPPPPLIVQGVCGESRVEGLPLPSKKPGDEGAVLDEAAKKRLQDTADKVGQLHKFC